PIWFRSLPLESRWNTSNELRKAGRIKQAYQEGAGAKNAYVVLRGPEDVPTVVKLVNNLKALFKPFRQEMPEPKASWECALALVLFSWVILQRRFTIRYIGAVLGHVAKHAFLQATDVGVPEEVHQMQGAAAARWSHIRLATLNPDLPKASGECTKDGKGKVGQEASGGGSRTVLPVSLRRARASSDILIVYFTLYGSKEDIVSNT
ncbi:unnamed protein product, partial [Symbiodinium sp. KB8]